jgi:GNAT superfamily N-acetyltransferase
MMKTYCKVYPATGIPIHIVLHAQHFDKPGAMDKRLCVALLDDRRDGSAVLMDIYTAPEERKKGYAKMLMDTIKGESMFRKIFTSWDASSDNGRKFCTKMGFARLKMSGQNWMVWEKPINGTPILEKPNEN